MQTFFTFLQGLVEEEEEEEEEELGGNVEKQRVCKFCTCCRFAARAELTSLEQLRTDIQCF